MPAGVFNAAKLFDLRAGKIVELLHFCEEVTAEGGEGGGRAAASAEASAGAEEDAAAASAGVFAEASAGANAEEAAAGAPAASPVARDEWLVTHNVWMAATVVSTRVFDHTIVSGVGAKDAETAAVAVLRFEDQPPAGELDGLPPTFVTSLPWGEERQVVFTNSHTLLHLVEPEQVEQAVRGEGALGYWRNEGEDWEPESDESEDDEDPEEDRPRAPASAEDVSADVEALLLRMRQASALRVQRECVQRGLGPAALRDFARLAAGHWETFADRVRPLLQAERREAGELDEDERRRLLESQANQLHDLVEGVLKTLLTKLR